MGDDYEACPSCEHPLMDHDDEGCAMSGCTCTEEGFGG